VSPKFRKVALPASQVSDLKNVTVTNFPSEISVTELKGTDVFHGQTSVGTSAVQITTVTAAKSITVKADNDNTAAVYVGISGVTTSNGFRLNPGEAITLYIKNPSVLYAISSATGQKLHYIGEL